ncbi:class I SAM-dependent methyltransferase [Micromonospora sp. HNM0581]|uniref:class I SAM-dependent methyltransferase n=1 Tax=Micromonospora sp. HNM0581 TaxID=2716341 RepID=UPI00146ED598|nr:class I SAM-dependent methyltransferase [Micromonospora sp. HNM0581]NLU78543.1 class I SAM-dependent methyltransferase [Micromonospora sp. HNM0581]
MKLKHDAPTTCALCGRDDRSRPALDGVLRRCADCGFVWTAEPGPPPDELYDEAYYLTDGYQDYFASSRQRRFEAGRRLRWLSSITRPSVLVEAGCAGGYFLEAARNAGYTATGIEVSHAATTYATQHLGVPVRHGYFEHIAPTLHADIVCAFHVLEHVDNPRTFLHAARHTLTPGGWLALEVPNIASAAATRLGHHWPAVAPRYHRWHFTPDTLRRMLRETGFEVVAHDTVFSRFYWRPLARIRHARGLLVADLAASRSPRIRHPHLGDLLRVLARRGPAGVTG